MIIRRGCKRCRGDLYREPDEYDGYVLLRCLQCGRVANPRATLPLVVLKQRPRVAQGKGKGAA